MYNNLLTAFVMLQPSP